MKKIETVAVLGSSSPLPSSPEYQLAYELGRSLAQAGFGLINGGYGGIMEASAKGASTARSSTITGVTCEAFGRSEPNLWIRKVIQTQTLQERLTVLIEKADAYVFLPGGTGTLLELAMVWELINKHFLDERPIICLTDYWKPLIDLLVRSGETKAGCVLLAESQNHVIKLLKEKPAAK